MKKLLAERLHLIQSTSLATNELVCLGKRDFFEILSFNVLLNTNSSY